VYASSLEVAIVARLVAQKHRVVLFDPSGNGASWNVIHPPTNRPWSDTKDFRNLLLPKTPIDPENVVRGDVVLSIKQYQDRENNHYEACEPLDLKSVKEDGVELFRDCKGNTVNPLTLTFESTTREVQEEQLGRLGGLCAEFGTRQEAELHTLKTKMTTFATGVAQSSMFRYIYPHTYVLVLFST